MAAYYNEIDSFCCDWLRQLIKRGLLPDGEIDNRSIEDVKPDDLREFTQCHFFAGIGGWPYALRLAGWPDDRQVWTGSCPCQPFSAAGKRAGTSDKRHLWPSFFWLISQCRPDTIIGEQVASKDALVWWDIVHTDLEAEGYACGVCDTCAAGFGAPHIRQRLYWVAHAAELRCGSGTERAEIQGQCAERKRQDAQSRDARELSQGLERCSRLGNAHCSGLQGQSQPDRSPQGWQEQAGCVANAGNETGGMVYTNGSRWNRRIFPQASGTNGQVGQLATDGRVEVAGAMPTNGFWANPDWLWCRDKKWRPIESGTVPLVDGLPEGMVSRRDSRAIRQRLQGYGNAIVIPQAVEFVRAVMEII